MIFITLITRFAFIKHILAVSPKIIQFLFGSSKHYADICNANISTGRICPQFLLTGFFLCLLHNQINSLNEYPCSERLMPPKLSVGMLATGQARSLILKKFIMLTNNGNDVKSIEMYNGTEISFLKGNDVMISLTNFAKAFPDKNLTQIINSQEIKDYCLSLTKLQNYSLADLVQVRRGGANPGTWANQKVALRVAQKLSPDFSVWVDTKLEELLTQGVATVTDDDDVIANAMAILQKRLDASRQQVQILESTVEYQQSEIKVLAPKAEYVDEVLQSTSTFTTTQIAKDLGMSAITLNKKLKEAGVQFHQSGQWMLYSKFQNKGYTDTRVMRFVRHDESIGTNQSMVWTEKGRQFIHSLQKGGML